ncbi:hypothetical protein MaudCBS49596_007763 [Microsporum audouinii]
MKLLAHISLATVVTGANIKNHFKDGCKGGYLDYPNIAPRICVSALHDGMTKGAATSNRDNLCGALKKHSRVGNSNHKCLGKLQGGTQYAGSSWTQPGQLNAKAEEKDIACTGQMAPYSLVLDDGHKYALSDMDDGMIASLYDLTVNGTAFQNVPGEYAAFEIEKESVQQRAQEIQA